MTDIGTGDRAAVIGNGQMGIVLSAILDAGGAEVTLWGRSRERTADLEKARESTRHLPNFKIEPSIRITSDGAAALRNANLVVCCVPTQYIRPVFATLAQHTPAGVGVVSTSKGIENSTLCRPTEIIADVLDGDRASSARPLASLSGPTIAEELARHLPATMIGASFDSAFAHRIQHLFSCSWLRVYRHDDLIGVELAGALKNVIAIAAGIVDGLGIGFNAKSALLSRGLSEISRLGVAMGARPETFFGIAGVGDLATTCFSPLGRNRSCGEALGKGKPLDDYLASTQSVVEGIATTRSVMQLAQAYDVEMPIAQAVNDVLFNGITPPAAIRDLMERDLKAERIG